MMPALEKILSKIPVLPVVGIICAYLAYDYYDWLNSPSSELGQKKAALKQSKQTLETAKKKLVSAEEFFRQLDNQRLRIRQLTSQLENTKATLSTEVDVANFVKMVNLEAKKLRLTIKGIRPESQRKKEYYIEVPFTVQVKGAYVQVMMFFDRISKLQQVIRISDFGMKPSGSPYTKYVELEGGAQLVTYKYLGTHADEVVNKPEMRSRSETNESPKGTKEEKGSKETAT